MKINKKYIAYIYMLIFITIASWNFESNSSEAAEKRTVRVAVGINNALYLKDDGKLGGYCAVYLQQLAWLEDWNLEYVKGSWNESVQNLYNDKIDILFPTQMTKDRKGKMAFSSYIGGYQPIGLYARKDDDIYYNDYSNIDNKRVAISSGTSNSAELDRFAKEHNISYTPVEYNSTEDKIKALNNGDVDLIAFSTFNNVDGGKVVAVLDYLPFYYCTRNEDTELMRELNDGMRQLMANYPDMAGELYMNTVASSDVVTFTRQEHKAIENTDKLVFGAYNDSLPMAGVDSKGNYIGIYIDLIKEIEKQSDIDIEVKLIDRSQNIYDCLDDGTVDFVMGTKNLAYTAADTSTILASESIMDYITVAVTMADYKFDEAKKPTFALTRARRYWKDYIEEKYPDSTIRYYEDTKQCLIAVQKGQADATLINLWEYNYQSKNARFENMLEWESMRITSDLVVATNNKTSQVILSVVDKAVNQISQEQKDEIVASNVNMTYVSYDTVDRLYSMRITFFVIGSIMIVICIIFCVYVLMRRRNEKNLKEKNRELESANKAKSDFLSRMSHELRTPLNAMMGYSSLMKQNIESDEVDNELLLRNLSYSDRASRYLLEIIGDILDIQNIESGKITIVKEKVNAQHYMKNIVDIIEQEANEKHIEFEYKRLTHFSDGYMLDGVHFQQILLNILHNAVKFTPEGGKVTMTAGAINQDENLTTVQFVISDTGIGMSTEFINEKLFKKFAQENQGITSPYEGCGTGLAISKQLIELMGGDITCVSQKGKGSTFSITITTEHIKKITNRRQHNKEKVSYDLSGIRVLLCEDNPMNQDMEKRVLERMKCEVDIADDGQIGLEKYKNSDEGYYSIILMDIRMPNMDGLEAAKRIRELERDDAKSIPILAVSANAFDEDIKLSVDAGMNEHLAKPVGGKILYRKITEYCNI